MDLKAFNTPQEIIEGKYPVKNFWIIAVDIGFSSVKGLAPNKRFCFPSYVKKMNSSLMSIDEEDIYYRAPRRQITHLCSIWPMSRTRDRKSVV